MSRGEKFQGEAIFIAQCGESNPVQRFVLKEGYNHKCRKCGKAATHKTLFISPKGEVEGFFGPVYHCENCAPDINEVASNSDLFYGLIFGNVK